MPLRPKVELLTREEVSDIVAGAYDLLKNMGIMVDNEEALRALWDAGAKVDPVKKVAYLGADLIDKARKNAPMSISLYNQAGEKALSLEGDSVHFVTDSATVKVLDSESREIRKATTDDLVQMVKLAQNLEYVDFVTAPVVPGDMSRTIGDVLRFYLILNHCTKPVFGGAFSREGLLIQKELLAILAGGEENLREKPRAVMASNPSAPLQWSKTSVSNLVDCARYGIPVMIIPIPLAGATTPATLVGTALEHTAECLSGVVISQCISPGAPVIFGGGAVTFDMKKGTNCEGAIETRMMAIATNSQVGKFLNLPTAANCGRSDSKIVDAQAGMESSLGFLLGGLAGINMIRGVGMLEHGGTISIEKMAFDNDVCGMVYRLLRGLDFSTETLAVEFIKEMGHEANGILNSMHTFSWFKKEQFFPSPAIDRASRREFSESGGKDTFERSKEVVREKLARCRPVEISGDKLSEMKKVVRDYARRMGEGAIPGYLE